MAIMSKNRGCSEAKFVFEHVDGRDGWGNTPLHNAVRLGDVDSVAHLILEGSDVNAAGMHGWTPLMLAAGLGREEIISILIANGADINMKNDNEVGKTAMSYACDMGECGSVLILQAELDRWSLESCLASPQASQSKKITTI